MNKLKKTGIIIGAIAATIGAFWGVVNIIPPAKVTKENPWLTNETMIVAHRGGSTLNPENTEKAFDYVIIETNYTDVVEIDVLRTKDNVLVLHHDDSMDRMALDEERSETTITKDVVIKESNYEDLLQYNMGRNFVDRNKNQPYKDLTIEEAKEEKLIIMTLQQFLTKYQSYDIKLYLEIKEKDSSAIQTTDMVINDVLELPEYAVWKERTMIISSNNAVIDHMAKNYPSYLTGCVGSKIAGQLATTTLRLTSLCTPNYHSFQTKMVNNIGPLKINTATKNIIEDAHKRNQTVTFYTINNEEDMKTLIDLGADAITTDCPDKLAKVLGKI